jgi:hypothetical protein
MITARLFAAALLCAAATASAQPAPALRVVVVEGEDAVNIIQQKTAVRPVVEVRDRNNLPVSGALVTFSIEGGKAASFGGASTLTVATNAAGQAAVTGLTPSAAGAFQIQVSAAFQGQVATATIAQTNVMTAAQAAAAGASSAPGASSASGASGASSASGASGAGGGLSTTTIAVAGAAVAGGAVAATQIAGKEDDSGSGTFTGSFSGPIVSTLVSRNSGNTCTINRSVSGTATLNLDRNDGTNVSGRIELQGTDNVASANCPVQNPSTQFVGTTTVTGTQTAFGGSETRTDTNSGAFGETIQATTTVSFEGSLNGTTVTGTLNYDQKSVSSGSGGGPVDGVASGTFTLTLTKS